MSALADILSDRSHGAAFLAETVLQYFRGLSDANLTANYFDDLDKLHSCFDSMGFFINLPSISKAGNVQNDIRLFLSKLEKYLYSIKPDLFQTVSAVLSKEKKFIMNSHSSTVLFILERFHELHRDIHVDIFISSPGAEGRISSSELSKLGISNELLQDDNLSALQGADAVLLGSDLCTPDFFINKIGSCAISASARKYKTPVYVFGDPLKAVTEKESRNFDSDLFEEVPFNPMHQIVFPGGIYDHQKFNLAFHSIRRSVYDQLIS